MKPTDDSSRALALPRTLLIALLVVAALFASSFGAARSSQGLTANLSPRTSQPRELSRTDRYAYQRAIEEVYWRHRIWPKERPDPKPSLDEVMAPGQIEQKVENSFQNCRVLEAYWQEPIRAGQLQAEIDRMARQTKQPEVLRELFDALGNDPFVIAECLAKPVLSERLVSKLRQEQRIPLDDESWAAGSAEKMANLVVVSATGYTLPAISGKPNGFAAGIGNVPGITTMPISGGSVDSCEDDTWTATSALPGRESATAVWTGTEMIVWGGFITQSTLSNTGSRYNPSTDSWLPTSITNTPVARYFHTAVWTGTEMIIWGGYDLNAELNTGGRYNPGTDSWTATTLTNAPSARSSHTAVWAGKEMIVWGGNDTTGGRYDPETDSWTPTSLTNAPSARSSHTAIWTGTEMIVWGGLQNLSRMNTGGRYNPGTDSWTPTSTNNAPVGRDRHSAVWTGSEMIVWGGEGAGFSASNTGGRYNPGTDSWTPTSINVAGRESHSAFWTGTEMMVWGGLDQNGDSNTGARYSPGTNSWTTINSANAPSPREGPTAVWTGTEMIVWGGWYNEFFNTGGRYNPATDSWTATSLADVPEKRYRHTAIWTGAEMIIWGGAVDGGYANTGAKYSPATDSWTATSVTNAPTGRESHTAVWTGTEMIVWGGDQDLSSVNTGGKYNPGTDGWTPTSTTNAPTARYDHAAVWTGTEMIVWGGAGGATNGGRYNPSTNSWTATSTANAPTAREEPTVIWTGTEMIVWGGQGGAMLNNGGRYNPSTNSWTPTNTTNAPTGRWRHSAIWTGTEMIVWGGQGGPYLNTGGKYNPGTDSWTATSTTNAPIARDTHLAVWTGTEMIVWGGYDGTGSSNTGGRYNPSSDSWRATNILNAPTDKLDTTVIWTGMEMIVWGGFDFDGFWNTGGRYCAQSGPTTLANISTRLRVETGDNALIGGFIITGTQPKKVIVRGIGPSLPFAGALADPILELHNSSGALLASNDNWRDTQEGEIIATGIPPASELESAVVATLPANNAPYTVIVRGKNNGTGVGLVEVYDLEPTVDSKLANISTRGFVGTADNVMIGGMIVRGGSSSSVILRGIGPSLANSGVPDALADPTLELRDGNGALLVANDNWQDDSVSAAQLIAYGLAPETLESGIFVSLTPGPYTAILAGSNNGTGVGLVEAYQLQ